NVAASVFPPAVGASRIASCPATSGAAAASCRGRNPGHPRELAMWCWTDGARASNPEGCSVIAEIQLNVVGILAGPSDGGVRLAHRHGVVPARIELGELVHAVEHVHELAQEDARGESHLGAQLA